MQELTAGTFDHSCWLCEDGVSGPKSLDVIPDLVAGFIRVNGGNTRALIRQGFWEAFDALVISLEASSNDEGVVGQRPSSGSGERRRFGGK